MVNGVPWRMSDPLEDPEQRKRLNIFTQVKLLNEKEISKIYVEGENIERKNKERDSCIVKDYVRQELLGLMFANVSGLKLVRLKV